jgi:ferredoxin-type protein NapH
MRDMADINSDISPPTTAGRWRKLTRLRPWIQTGFLGVWLAPLSRWVGGIPGCVFHCYACPLASFACPIGIAANFSAVHAFPFLTVGILALTAGLIGSLVCGWACPFGFLQDLFAKIPLPKFRLPQWTGHFRYAVLIALVIVVPFFLGEADNPVFICKLCPAGAFEAGVPRMIQGAITGETVSLSTVKWVILGVFLVGMVFTYRPWCKVFCPLGGFLSLFNRISIFHLRFRRAACTQCNTCRARCPMGLQVEKRANVSECIRCMECTTCGAIEPAIGAK